MVLPALAVLLDRAALDALGGDRSDEQRGHGDGGESDGEVTHGVFSLVSLIVSLAFSVWIFHIIFLCRVYIYRNFINVWTSERRSLFITKIHGRYKSPHLINWIIRHFRTWPCSPIGPWGRRSCYLNKREPH
jgi:hypothetical protein